jgi:hypothetical protein
MKFRNQILLMVLAVFIAGFSCVASSYTQDSKDDKENFFERVSNAVVDFVNEVKDFVAPVTDNSGWDWDGYYGENFSLEGSVNPNPKLDDGGLSFKPEVNAGGSITYEGENVTAEANVDSSSQWNSDTQSVDTELELEGSIIYEGENVTVEVNVNVDYESNDGSTSAEAEVGISW